MEERHVLRDGLGYAAGRSHLPAAVEHLPALPRHRVAAPVRRSRHAGALRGRLRGALQKPRGRGRGRTKSAHHLREAEADAASRRRRGRVDLTDGKEGFDFLGCHLHMRMSGQLWEEKRIRRYYLQRWPSKRSMKRVRTRVKELTDSRRNGVKDVEVLIRDLNPVLRGWGTLLLAPGMQPGSFSRSTSTSCGG